MWYFLGNTTFVCLDFTQTNNTGQRLFCFALDRFEYDMGY